MALRWSSCQRPLSSKSLSPSFDLPVAKCSTQSVDGLAMLVAKARAEVGLTLVFKVASSITISDVTGVGPSGVWSLSGTFRANTEIQLEAASSFNSVLSNYMAPERSAFLAPSSSIRIANSEFTIVTCLIAELAKRSLLERLILI